MARAIGIWQLAQFAATLRPFAAQAERSAWDTQIYTQVVELLEVWRGYLRDEGDWPVGVVSILLLLLIARVAGWNRRRLLARQVLQQVRDSNPHPVRVHRGPDARGFVVESHPAPPPFSQLMILYTPSSRLDPVGLLRWLLRRHAQRLCVRAMVLGAPAAELVWLVQPRYLPVSQERPGRDVWVQRRLDFNGELYRTRGTDTAALEHVFAEFQTRFGPLLQEFIVSSERQPQVEIVLAAPRLDSLTIAGLLISLRSVGRAASSGPDTTANMGAGH